MIGTQCVTRLAPRDYTYALDAAIPLLASGASPAVICGVAALLADVESHIPAPVDLDIARAAVWIEPLAHNWRFVLRKLATGLPAGASLVVIASRPLARLLPERRGWDGRPLGAQLGGVVRLCSALRHVGFALEKIYGVHSAYAIGLSLLSQILERHGRADIADRMLARSRQHYLVRGQLAALATVGLIVAHRNNRESKALHS